MLPNFLIIGAQKAGSTWFAQMLRQHPDVFVYESGEIHFFNARFDRGLDWYEQHFAAWNGESAVGEKSPLYLSHPDAPSRIQESLGKEVRLIMSLRNPVDRAYSAFWHRMKHGRVPLDAQFTSVFLEDESLRQNGLYGEHVRRLLEHFPRRNLHILIFEEVMADRPSALADTFRFLGVDPSFSVPEPSRRVNASRDVSVLSRHLYAVRRSLKRLPAPLRAPVVKAGRRLFSVLPKNREHQPIDPGVRRQLALTFERDMNLLEGLLGRDLAVWRESRR